MKKQFALLFGLSILAFATVARGQFLWKVTQADDDWRYEYSINSLSCNGNDCTAAGFALDPLRADNYFPCFFRSSDGGHTWKFSLPSDLPHYRDTRVTNTHFTHVQQIDTKNVVVISDSGQITRTFDGGITWEQQFISPLVRLSSVHFSDAFTGIIVGNLPNGTGVIYITSDGGRNWVNKPHPGLGQSLLYSHSYGGGKFRISLFGTGRIYTTTDNWEIATLSPPLVDSLKEPQWKNYSFAGSVFDNSDAIFAYGNYYDGKISSAIVRSYDGGNHWEAPYYNPGLSKIFSISSITRDTIVAGGIDGHILRSTDKGNTWTLDTFAVSFDGSSYPVASNGSLEFANNNLVGLLYAGGGPRGTQLAVSSLSTSSVASPLIAPEATISIQPNPASDFIRIHCNTNIKEIAVCDILGRKVREEIRLSSGEGTFDIHTLSAGCYVLVNTTGGLFSKIGNFFVE